MEPKGDGSPPIPTKSSLSPVLSPPIPEDDDVCRIFHSDYDAVFLSLSSLSRPNPNLSYFRQSRFRRLALLSLRHEMGYGGGKEEH